MASTLRNLRIDSGTRAALDRLAADRGVTLSALVTDVIEEIAQGEPATEPPVADARLTVSVDDALWARAQRVAGRRGLSAAIKERLADLVGRQG
jgi:antitoxin component of RelBE/YafQ-DinJ toxin-antitoxin module